jgi:hypothetical protein
MKKILTALTLLFVLAILPQTVQAQTDVKPAKKETAKKTESKKATKATTLTKEETQVQAQMAKKQEIQNGKPSVAKKAKVRKQPSAIPVPSKDKPAEAVVKPITRKKKTNQPKKVAKRKDN